MLENAKTNFDKLESRLLAINSDKKNANDMSELIYSLVAGDRTSLIMATGGSKVVAYYLQMLVEAFGGKGLISQVIEPRDYFHRYDIDSFSRLAVISASGNTNGVNEALDSFKGEKFLVCENKQDRDFDVITWGNDSYEKENSFISIASSLGPIVLMLDTIFALGGYEKGIIKEEMQEVDKLVSRLINLCKDKISNLPYSFKDEKIVHIMSGYDTRCACNSLESNLVEAGLCAPIIHDKGSFCHGRSTLVSRDTPVIYLSHKKNELDKLLLDNLPRECDKVYEFNIDDLDECYFVKEFYLILQMHYLSKKIAEDNNKDLTKPNYKKELVPPLYKYRGKL